VYYGSAPREAAYHRDGQVFDVGGANPAGQAALYLAEFAAHVTMVVRAGSLVDGTLQPLVARCEAHPRITVRTKRTSCVRSERSGSRPCSSTSPGTSKSSTPTRSSSSSEASRRRRAPAGRVDAGFFLTGPDVLADGGRGTWWKLEREPMSLESSSPGVFFAGDVRHGSIKRVASAVGEGAMAVQQVHQFLDEHQRRT